jgi:hypothetical protein
MKTIIKRVGNIMKTNDNVLDKNSYSKPNRRVVVTYDNGKTIKVNKITKDKDFVSTSTAQERTKQKKFTTKIDYLKYPKSLNKASVVDKKQYKVNQATKKSLTYNDKELVDLHERLDRTDMKKVNKLIKKSP